MIVSSSNAAHILRVSDILKEFLIIEGNIQYLMSSLLGSVFLNLLCKNFTGQFYSE